MQLLSAFILIMLFLPIAAVLAFTPYFTRETISFGVSVSEEHYRSDLLRKMRKKFASISVVIYSILLLTSLIVLVQTGDLGQSITVGVCVIVMIIVSVVMNLTFYFKMKKLKPSLPPGPTSGKTILAIDTSFRQHKLILSNKWFLVHFAITVICTIFVFANYDRIPEIIAMKFDFQGNVISSAAKSYWSVLFPNIMQVIMLLVFLMVNHSISSSKQQIHAGDPERSIRRNIVFRRKWSLFTLLSAFAITFLFAFIQLNMIYPMKVEILAFVSILVPVFIVLFAIILAFTTGQGGSRIERSEVGSPIQPVNDDAYWKLGVIYFNPKDPAIWVEKRSGIGWTINTANPMSWIIFIGLIGIITLVTEFAK